METIIVDLPQIARGHDERFDGDERVDRLLIGLRSASPHRSPSPELVHGAATIRGELIRLTSTTGYLSVGLVGSSRGELCLGSSILPERVQVGYVYL